MEFIKGTISVVLPVYNSETSIKKCIESVLNQSYRNFELIVIDDGSKDNSYGVCESILKNVENSCLLRQCNMGVSGARNTGLQYANGEFVFFIDSDDTLHKDCFQELMENNVFDLVACSFVRTNENKPIVFPDISTHLQLELGTILLNNLSTGFSYVWGKLFKRNIIHKNNILFSLNFSLGEDTLFVNQYLKHIQSIKLKSFLGYNYSVAKNKKGLSFQSVRFNYLENQLMQLINSYHDVEHEFNIDLSLIRLEIKQFFVHRHIASFASYGVKLGAKRLKHIFEHENLKDIFDCDGEREKGKIQVFFDFLIKNRSYKVAFVYWKYVGKYYF